MGGGSNADDFYTLASARQAYKNHLKVVTSRKNSINGKVGAALHLYLLLRLRGCAAGLLCLSNTVFLLKPNCASATAYGILVSITPAGPDQTSYCTGLQGGSSYCCLESDQRASV